MDMKQVKQLLQGQQGGFTDEEIIENSRGTYFEKFIDEIMATRKKYAEQRAREATMMENLKKQMQVRPVPSMGYVQPEIPFATPRKVSSINPIDTGFSLKPPARMPQR